MQQIPLQKKENPCNCRLNTLFLNRQKAVLFTSTAERENGIRESAAALPPLTRKETNSYFTTFDNYRRLFFEKISFSK